MANKVLIIEDEEVLLDIYKEKFKQEGFDIVLTNNVEEGLKDTRDKQPDIVLLDLLLPQESGLEYLKKKQEDDQIKSIPVIVLSNYSRKDMMDKAQHLAIEDYLIKANYTPQQLVEKVKQHLT